MKYSVWAKGLEKMELHLHNVLSTRSLKFSTIPINNRFEPLNLKPVVIQGVWFHTVEEQIFSTNLCSNWLPNDSFFIAYFFI